MTLNSTIEVTGTVSVSAALGKNPLSPNRSPKKTPASRLQRGKELRRKDSSPTAPTSLREGDLGSNSTLSTRRRSNDRGFLGLERRLGLASGQHQFGEVQVDLRKVDLTARRTTKTSTVPSTVRGIVMVITERHEGRTTPTRSQPHRRPSGTGIDHENSGHPLRPTAPRPYRASVLGTVVSTSLHIYQVEKHPRLGSGQEKPGRPAGRISQRSDRRRSRPQCSPYPRGPPPSSSCCSDKGASKVARSKQGGRAPPRAGSKASDLRPCRLLPPTSPWGACQSSLTSNSSTSTGEN